MAEIEAWLQWATYRKWLPGNQTNGHVTDDVT